MERFFKLLYYYLLGLFMAFVVYLCIMLFISPRQDKLQRGFIPCTARLVEQFSLCEQGQIGCVASALWQDTKCNAAVILEGLGAWVRGQQPTPWANYLYEPVAYNTDENTSGWDLSTEEQQHEFTRQKIAELEAAKKRDLKLAPEVLMSAPENTLPNDVKEAELPTLSEDAEVQNIDDETAAVITSKEERNGK